MFKLIQNTPVGGDCTCGYDVKLDREYTIEEFINTVLKIMQTNGVYLKSKEDLILLILLNIVMVN